ncbi:glycosyltransferase family 2 protein [Sinorhizobium sp. RAC02]|uniref:glycosyltransferase family 2 protein n=1 Tax=Sinorhizobium sp. RAC02 TaxID=1842534 RepID=UPI00083D90EC|nr:glycosyltransferase family 2 protein [Sinorhizobium sp. RAC02]AOF92917.1 glycosyltransferase like 2 family protein [Sinorhizobium sp. RAC02]
MTVDAVKSVRCLIVIPCLNEASYLEPLIQQLEPTLKELTATLVVVDGGSTDGTRDIAKRLAQSLPNLHVLDNPRRIQAAAINLAVETFGLEHDYLIRIDAHGTYPHDYCRVLVEEALATEADSVVVAMQTVGFGLFQKATAVAQNSVLGNGGAKHRAGAESHWVDHGHHALMRISAFRAVGGYDENFNANEDAECDYRLNKAGYRIWMTARTSMIYYPRASAPLLFKQYFRYGRGRARNFLKHRSRPSLRQMIPLMVAPVAVGAFLAAITWIAAVPFVLWAAACLGYGAWMALGQRNPYGPLAAVSAMIMHFAWSAGFWREVLDLRQRRVVA